jgi:predicted dehydrogenase
MSKGKVKVGIVGSRFEADIHAESFRILPEEAEVIAVASPTPGNAASLAKKYGIPNVYTDYREMFKNPEVEMITITAPNVFHCPITLDAANAGKHVVCEKPFSMTLEEADLMVESCKKQGVLLMYAEELYFTPKYVKAKEMADWRVGNVVSSQSESTRSHAEWFGCRPLRRWRFRIWAATVLRSSGGFWASPS